MNWKWDTDINELTYEHNMNVLYVLNSWQHIWQWLRYLNTATQRNVMCYRKGQRINKVIRMPTLEIPNFCTIHSIVKTRHFILDQRPTYTDQHCTATSTEANTTFLKPSQHLVYHHFILIGCFLSNVWTRVVYGWLLLCLPNCPAGVGRHPTT